MYDASSGDLVSINHDYEFRLPVHILEFCKRGYELKFSETDVFGVCKAC